MADKSIGSLSKATSLNDDSLLVVEQQGEARSVAGAVVKQYAREATADYAEQAKADADRAAEKAKDAADVAIHPPKIQNGNWWTWDTAKNAYVDSGTDAGVSLTIAETVTGAPGDPAKVENVGTATDPKLKFTIPLGNQGPVTSVNGQQGDVVIGGRNLVLASGGERTYTGGASNAFAEWLTLSEPLQVRQVLTLSFEVKGSNPESSCVLDIRDPSNGNVSLITPLPSYQKASPTEEYKKYSWTGELNNYSSKIKVCVFWYGSGGAGEITYKNIKVEYGNLATDWSPAPEDYLGPFNIYDVPEMHRNIYRGKNLGYHVTEAQKAAIAAGTWDDLYVGDYWTINGRVYRIADMDYWYNCGDTAFTKHHLVIVPDASFGNAQMNSENITTGGYMLSEMYTTNLATAKSTIKTDFGDLLQSHREILTNATKDGYPSGYAWTDSEVDLMNEIMVYGCNVYSTMGNGSIIPTKYTIDNSQLALFALNPRMIKTRYSYWLRDVASPTLFANANSTGGANCRPATGVCGIRPAFAIGVATESDEPVDGPEIMDTYEE